MSPKSLPKLWLPSLSLVCGLSGCNAMLGIDEPKEETVNRVDSSPPTWTGDDEDDDDGAGGGDDGKSDSGGDDDPPDMDDAGNPVPDMSSDVSSYAWAAWPMPNPTSLNDAGGPQQFVNPGEEVVTDAITKLEWQQAVDNGPISRDEAERYCSKLRLMGGGYRLPSRIELLSILDYTTGNPYLDDKAFPNAPTGKYWTSSRAAKSAASGWIINFEFGTNLVQMVPGSEEHLVRCVR